MELRQLRYFLAVAEQLHFTKAAKLLNLAQPALSHQVRVLEEEIGVRLLERTNRCVQLTPAGRAFQTQALAALEHAELGVATARRIERGEEGILRIGFVSTTALVILPRLLELFYQKVPSAIIELTELDPAVQLEALQKDKLDMGVTSMLSNVAGMEARFLSSEPLLVALPEKHPAAQHRTVDLKWLSEERLLLPSRHNVHGIYDQIVTACLEAGFMPKRENPVRMSETAVFLVAGGLGVALVPACFRNLQVKGVVYRPLKKPICNIEFFAVRRREQPSALLNRLWNELESLSQQ